MEGLYMDPHLEPAKLELMTAYFLRKLDRFSAADDELRKMIKNLCRERVEFEPGHMLAEQGMDYSGTWLIDNGWVIRSKSLHSGTRQIVNVAIPSDFVSLNAVMFRTSEFDLTCQTAVAAYKINLPNLVEVFGRYPLFATALFWMNAQEESLLAERIVTLGRRSALERTAHVICEFVSRLQVLDEDDPTRLFIPLSQQDLSDILGLSLVHTNKTLRRLENEGLVSFRNEILSVNDRDGLEKLAGFDDGYIYFADRSDRMFGIDQRAILSTNL